MSAGEGALPRIVVQKFGGTSVATEAQRRAVVERVKEAIAEGLAPVVVVSAMGRRGDPYATDTLLDLLPGEGPRPPERELALLMSVGEVIAIVVLSHALQAAGIASRALTGAQAGIVTDANLTAARVLEVRPERVRALCAGGVVPVIAGFQGADASGEVTTLGRGGSDTTAAVMGVALNAVRVDIFTDVDGMKTADPRLVPGAATLRHVSYEEAAQMAHLGAKVVHPRAVEAAMQGRVPLRVLATAVPGGGTWVGDAPGAAKDLDRLVTGVAHVAGLAQIWLPAAGVHAERVFSRFAQAGLSLDMLWVSPEVIAFVVEGERAPDAERVLRELQLDARVRTGVAKVSVVGAGMHGVPGVMAKVMAALAQAGIQVLQSVDSHVNISCLVEERRLAEAVQRLHEAFALEALA